MSFAADTQLSLPESALSNAQSHYPPPVVPGYTVLNQIGQGAFGSVWRCLHNETEEDHAVKQLKAEHAKGTEVSTCTLPQPTHVRT